MTSEEPRPCPRCGSWNVERGTTVDLAFGEEIPCVDCLNCGYFYDLGIYPKDDDSQR